MEPGGIRQIGPYDVVRLIAEGGMSWVFEVVDHRLEVRRALKLLKPAAAAGMEFKRFEIEAQVLARLDDPNLVTIYDFGTDPGTGCLFYTMSLIDGCTLSQLGSVPVKRACEIVLDALSGLTAIHDAGIIHRDIKPGNILVSKAGHAQLADLGIARAEEGDLHLTKTGMMVGTVLYASPEHVRGQPVTKASDVFSMGLTLYKTLTGELPYDNVEEIDTTSSQDVIMYLGSLVHSGAEFVLSFPRSIPDPIRRVVLTACRLRPEQRYPDARAMRAALRAALVESSAAPRPRRRRAALPLALGAVALAALAAYPLLSGRLDPSELWTALTGEGASPREEPKAAASQAEVPPIREQTPLREEPATEAAAAPEEGGGVEDPIRALLARADEQLEQRRLTSPAGDNALESYRAVLELSPDDARAQDGLIKIRGRYLEWAARAEERADLEVAAGYYERALRAVPGDEEVERRRAALSERIARAREEREARAAEAPAADDAAQQLAAVEPSPPSAMVRVEAGPFPMGEGGSASGTTEAFAIDRTEVTTAAYAKCVDAGACRPILSHRNCNSSHPDRAEHPANCVSFSQARRYCEWEGKRLPTGEEWEKAARGTEGATYAWGGAAPACGLLVGRAPDCTVRGTAPVGSKPAGASPYGALDMMGNVWEWTLDAAGDRHVLRGGAWNTAPVGADHRYPYPDKGTPSTGFRCVR
jgi:formylglycine-generating enzyme required for sulfatase activity